MMARVRGVIMEVMVAAVMFWLSRSMSTNMGVAPAVTMQETEARNVREVTMTSSPCSMFKALRERSRATVPLVTETAYSVPHHAENSF